MTRRSPAIAIGAIIAGAVALGAAAIPLTNHPKFCASCHTIKPSYESWVQSTHKEVECVSCHVRPGIEGWLHDKAWNGTKDLAISLFGTPTSAHDLQSHVDSSVCLSCHRNILRVSEIAVRDLPPPVKDVGLIMSHRKHMDAFAERDKGEGCTTCHAGVVHDQPIKGYPIVIPRGHVSADSKPWLPEYPEGSALRSRAMADCFRCHDNKTEHKEAPLSRKCETCHLPEKLKDFLSF